MGNRSDSSDAASCRAIGGGSFYAEVGDSTSSRGRGVRQRRRRVFFISVVEEQHIVSSEQSAEDSVTVFEAQIQDFQQDWVAVQPVDQSFGRSPLQTAIVSGATPAPW